MKLSDWTRTRELPGISRQMTLSPDFLGVLTFQVLQVSRLDSDVKLIAVVADDNCLQVCIFLVTRGTSRLFP